VDNNETFERLYNELEDLLRTKYHLEATASAVYFHENRVGGQQAKNLRILRELRNYVVHGKRNDVIEACVVTDVAIRYLEKTIDAIKRPVRAIDTCTLHQKILFASLSSPLKPLMKTMLERNISHVPILRSDGTVYGVFSGATLFAGATANEKMAIDDATTVQAFSAYLPIKNHAGERYWFIARTTPIEEIIELFGTTMQDGKKLKMLFVTENGRPEEKILGLITPWDILDDDVVAA